MAPAAAGAPPVAQVQESYPPMAHHEPELSVKEASMAAFKEEDLYII